MPYQGLQGDRALVEPRISKLLQSIEAKFEHSRIPTDKWYLTVLGGLLATPESYLADHLYLYLISKATYATSEARKALIRRMREALIKGMAVVGFPKTCEAIISISRAEPEEDLDSSFSREKWQCDKANHERGLAWLKRLYAENTSSLFSLFKTHRDFEFWLTDIIYGLHLSDRQILDDLDTQLVILPALMGQNLPRETYWHIRGTRRLGISKEDVGMVCECVHQIAQFCEVKLDRVPAVDDVDEDLK